MNLELSTAVALIIFKRPSQTERVFKRIAEAKPSRLYIIADGPRNSEETLLCQETRQIVETVDWNCDVRKNYAETNIGLRNRIISGLDWVFEQEDRAIILEDDCLADPTFFRFCDELLTYYKDDEQVMHISGDNFLMGKRTFAASYYFSRYAHVWGWATWRRAWLLFHKWDGDFSSPKLDYQIFQTASERTFWKNRMEQLRSHRMDYTWDYQWALTCLAYRRLCVMPATNLVSNIGFGSAATHTQGTAWFAELPTFPVKFPLTHPFQKIWDSESDKYSANSFFNTPPFSWVGFVKTFMQRPIAVIKKMKRML